ARRGDEPRRDPAAARAAARALREPRPDPREGRSEALEARALRVLVPRDLRRADAAARPPELARDRDLVVSRAGIRRRRRALAKPRDRRRAARGGGAVLD